MCGIAGIVSKKIPLENSRIERIISRIKHRGPDETGFHKTKFTHIGMCRLSIIDLTSPGLCPLTINNEYILAFNGEIYNFIEIREELEKKGYTFRTKSDTEVLLMSYIEWGIDCLEKFNGMFAFAIADYKRDILFLARDRAGEKPLYWYEDENKIVFCSEIKGILEILNKVEEDFTEEFETLQFSVSERTIFKGVKSLNPATYMIVNGIKGNFVEYKIKKYWDVKFDKEIPNKKLGNREIKKYIDTLDELINDSVKLRLRADVPLGIYLSGGIDSSLIGCIAKPPVSFYCRFAYGDNYDEYEYSKYVSKITKSELIVVEPKKEDFEKFLPKIVYHLDMPVGSFSILPLFMLAMKAREYVKIVLSGEGADELFAGYIRYLIIYHEQKIYEIEQFRNYKPLIDFYLGSPLKRFSKLSNRSQLPSEIVEKLLSEYFKFTDPIHNMGYAEFRTLLVSLLQMEDRMSAAFGIENRTPFLDHRLIEFAFSIPSELKIKDYITKYILREVAKRYIPKKIYARKMKMGLIAPINIWFNFKGARGEFDRSSYFLMLVDMWRKIFIQNEYSF